MSAPAVSVVVPTHDRAATLPRLLATVLRQSWTDLELIVVDDGSSDETSAVLAACTDPRLRTVRHERPRGVASARNSGTQVARGRYVAWCDDDDVWAPDKLALQLAALDATPGARWCNGGAAHVDADLHLLRSRPCPDRSTIALDLLRVNLVTGGGSGVVAERALALSVGGFAPTLSMYADWEMWARLAQAAPLAVVDLPLVGYVQTAGGMSREGLHRALRELTPLSESLDRLAAARGLPSQLDRHSLGHWKFRQQTGAGRRLQNLLLPYRLHRHELMHLWRAVPSSLVSAAAPSLLQRRWQRRWEVDERQEAYARAWLGQARSSSARQDLTAPPPRSEPDALMSPGSRTAGSRGRS